MTPTTIPATVNQPKSKSVKVTKQTKPKPAGRTRPKPKVVVSARVTEDVEGKLQSFAVEAGHLSVSQAVAEILQKFVEKKYNASTTGSK